MACVKLLLAAGADKDAKTDVRIANLCLAHLFGLPAGFRACSQHAFLHSQDGYTPLYIATFNGHETCVKMLLAAGADTDAKDNVRIGKLCVSHFLCCRQLSQHVSPRNPPPSQDGYTPLHTAALKGHVACVQLLLGAGADKDAKADVRIDYLCVSLCFAATSVYNMPHPAFLRCCRMARRRCTPLPISGTRPA